MYVVHNNSQILHFFYMEPLDMLTIFVYIYDYIIHIQKYIFHTKYLQTLRRKAKII